MRSAARALECRGGELHDGQCERVAMGAEALKGPSHVERLDVRAALTRKNFLFAGADSGGDRAAIAFTILVCCRLAGVDPLEYLADVL